MSNIILIGMPGAGKSTIGVVLAKTLGYEFIDTDLVIQQVEGHLLQEIINSDGMAAFLDIEATAVKTVTCTDSVIATGGSVVYRDQGMAHLKGLGQVVFLDVAYDEIERRINNITTRGIAIREGATLKDIYNERKDLYQQYQDITIRCDGKTVEEVIAEIIEII